VLKSFRVVYLPRYIVTYPIHSRCIVACRTSKLDDDLMGFLTSSIQQVSRLSAFVRDKHHQLVAIDSDSTTRVVRPGLAKVHIVSQVSLCMYYHPKFMIAICLGAYVNESRESPTDDPATLARKQEHSLCSTPSPPERAVNQNELQVLRLRYFLRRNNCI
jgi:hypothetical protein